MKKAKVVKDEMRKPGTKWEYREIRIAVPGQDDGPVAGGRVWIVDQLWGYGPNAYVAKDGTIVVVVRRKKEGKR